MSVFYETTDLGPADRIEQIWETLPSADRVVLLGHDRDTLTAAEKATLAKAAAGLAADRRNPGPVKAVRKRSKASARATRRRQPTMR